MGFTGEHARGRILPVAGDVDRPLWSVMIPTFNCASYLRATLNSVLEQDPGPRTMQIEVVDDCSTKDDPQAVVEELGKGRVSFFRNPHNLGVTGNFNTCLSRATGHLVHLLHGDDLVEPGFYRGVGALAERSPDAALFATRAFMIDAEGQIETISARVRELEGHVTRDATSFLYANMILTPAVVIRRSFYERWGGFDSRLNHVADWEMWVRAIADAGGVMLNEPLCAYRVFSGNDTSRLMRTGGNLRESLTLGDIFAARFPSFERARFRRSIATLAAQQSERFKARGELDAANANERIWRETSDLPQRVMRRMRSIRSAL